jgi:hypothetical protein
VKGQRAIVGVGLGALFVAMMVWTTLSQTSAECEVCVTHQGRTECSTAKAATRDEAVFQAQSSACSILSNGVTSVMTCSRTAPSRISCDD